MDETSKAHITHSTFHDDPGPAIQAAAERHLETGLGSLLPGRGRRRRTRRRRRDHLARRRPLLRVRNLHGPGSARRRLATDRSLLHGKRITGN